MSTVNDSAANRTSVYHLTTASSLNISLPTLVTAPNPSDETSGVPSPTQKIKDDRSSTVYYDMSGDRLLYIFNHEKYEDSDFYKKLKPERRVGTKVDMDKLHQTFSNLKFKIDPCQDFTRAQIFNKLKEISESNHENTSCVAVVILTHGDEGGKVFAADQPYGLLDVFDYLMHEPRLAGKPKLFFIQACLGSRKDRGHWWPNKKDDEERTPEFKIPTYSDCIVLLASYEGYAAFRDEEEGSWMIQALCDVLDGHHKEEDILHMVTLVNDLVAEKMESTGAKQIPDTRYTLTKLLEF